MAANRLVSIVDDNESAREAILGLVRALGFLAAGFRSAAEFLHSAERPRTACLIADVQMPGMTGPELYEALAAAGTPIPTILITAFPSEAVRLRARRSGIECYLVKPFEPDALLDCIRAALGGCGGETD